MPRPSARAVVMFRANTETGVNTVMRRRTKSVPMVAIPPTTRGRPAATSPPKTATSSTRVRGTAINSARPRSEPTWLFTWWKATG